MTSVRRAGTASAATLSVLVSGLAAMHTLAPEWTQRVGIDVWNLPAVLEGQRAADDRAATIDAAQERATRRIEICGHITTRLLDAKMSLAEAVAEMAPLLQDVPGFQSTCKLHYQAPTYRHGVARYAIQRATQMLRHDPTRLAVVLERLEAEYAALK